MLWGYVVKSSVTGRCSLAKKHLTVNAQTVRRTQEMRGRDGIAKKISAPLQLKLRLDFQEHLLNAYVGLSVQRARPSVRR